MPVPPITRRTQLIPHRLDAVALFDTLVRDPANPQDILAHVAFPAEATVRRDSTDDRSRQERVCHGFHVHLAHRLERADRWTRDGRLCRGLYDGASHRLEDLLGKARVTLDGRGPDRRECAGRACDGGDGKRVCRARRVRLDREDTRFGDGVHPARNLVHVEQRAGFGVALAGDVDAKVAHEGDSHVDIELGNDSLTNEDESRVLLGIGGTEKNGRDVL